MPHYTEKVFVKNKNNFSFFLFCLQRMLFLLFQILSRTYVTNSSRNTQTYYQHKLQIHSSLLDELQGSLGLRSAALSCLQGELKTPNKACTGNISSPSWTGPKLCRNRKLVHDEYRCVRSCTSTLGYLSTQENVLNICGVMHLFSILGLL